MELGKISVLIEDIHVRSRQREVVGDIESLALSIARNGLINPIVVEVLTPPFEGKKYALIAGERRLRACKHLGWNRIDVTTRDQLSETQRVELELEENLRRKDLEWWEEVMAIYKLHTMKIQAYGERTMGKSPTGWGYKETAEELAMSIGKVFEAIELGAALVGNTDLRQEETKRSALRRLRTLKEGKNIRTEAEVVRNWLNEGLFDVPFLSKHELVVPRSVQLVIFDATEMTEYSAFFERIVSSLSLTGEGYVFFTTEKWPIIKNLLDQFKLLFDPSPRLFQYRGREAFQNFIRFSLHMAQNPPELKYVYNIKADPDSLSEFDKPINFLNHLIDMSSKKGDLILDPLAYGGSLFISAIQSQRNCRSFVSLPDKTVNVQNRIRKYLKG